MTAPSPETFLVLEESLTLRLLKTWSPIWNKISAAIIKAVDNDNQDAIEEAIARIKLESSMVGNRKYAKTIGQAAVIFGASRLSEVDEVAALDDQDVAGNIEKAVNQISMQLADASVKVRKDVRSMIEAAKQDKAKIKKGIVELAEGLGGKYASGESSINLAASLHTSRLASYGYTVEALLLGQATYAINEVLDSRTCPICYFMDGKVFEVKSEHERVKKVFLAETVDDLKLLAPWPSNTVAGREELSRMTAIEIQSSGYGSPPFHPLCRGIIDETDEKMPIEETRIDGIPGIGNIKPPTLEQLEQKVINRIIPRSGSVDLSGIDDLSIINQIVETLSFQIEKQGLKIDNLITVNKGKFLTRLSFSKETGYTLSINKKAINSLGDLADLDTLISAGANDGLHLARDLNELVIHDYGIRVTARKVIQEELSETFPGISKLADSGLAESAAELYLKSQVSTLSVKERAFLDRFLEWTINTEI